MGEEMKPIVFYRSISGFTEKYANIIGSELSCSVFKIEKISKIDLSKYDTLIFGGSLHAIGIIGLKILRKYLPRNSNVRIFIFAVGASPDKEGITEEIWKNNKLDDIGANRCKLFYLRGGFNFRKLDLTNKIIMFLLYLKLKYKRNKTEEENGMLKAYKTPVDFTNKDSIKRLIASVKQNQ